MEEQTKRTTILVLAALGVVIVIFVGIFYWLNKQKSASSVVVTPAQPAAQIVAERAEALPETTKTEVDHSRDQQPPDSKDAQLRRFCGDFIARFGTYSTDGGGLNLQQVLPLMTGDLKAWAEGQAAVSARVEKFSGVVTKALAVKIISQTATDAIVKVGTQRIYTEGDGLHTKLEDATMKLVHDATGWRVSGVTWEVRPN